MDKNKVVKVGGSIEKALKGEYQIDVASVLKEAWGYTKKSRASINMGLLFSLGLGMIASFFVGSFLGGIEEAAKDPQSFMMINIVITLIIWPFLAGVEMMGVFHAIGIKTDFKLTFAFLKRGSWVAVCALLTSLIISLGVNLFVLPGLYLAVALSLTIPLVVEKRMSPLKAIKLCILATRFQWFKIFTLYLALIMVLILSMLPLALFLGSGTSIIGIILFIFCLTYLAPMFYNVKGILYREIFGMQLLKVDGHSLPTDDVFSA
ncbi:MAG: hypothetical protein HRT38_19795 [Alteromonadaceae bacterium]|nr:hypothetical protein [Alteromonadaceae bacterium]